MRWLSHHFHISSRWSPWIAKLKSNWVHPIRLWLGEYFNFVHKILYSCDDFHIGGICMTSTLYIQCDLEDLTWVGDCKLSEVHTVWYCTAFLSFRKVKDRLDVVIAVRYEDLPSRAEHQNKSVAFLIWSYLFLWDPRRSWSSRPEYTSLDHFFVRRAFWSCVDPGGQLGTPISLSNKSGPCRQAVSKRLALCLSIMLVLQSILDKVMIDHTTWRDDENIIEDTVSGAA